MRARSRLAVTALLTVSAALYVAPVAWMVSTSLKTVSQIYEPVAGWIPRPPTLENYRSLADKASEAPVGRWLLNSAGVSISHVALVLLVCSMAAYPLARMRFRGRDVLFYILIAGMIVPGQVLIIPLFLLIQRLGWFDTYAALIVPSLASPFGVFLLRQYMQTVPRELEDAAAIDGCGAWRTWALVVLPLCRPGLATLATLSFLGSWNDFLWPLIATNSLEMRTIPVGLQVFQGHYASETGLMMACASVASIPALAVFLAMGRYITSGFVLSGLKG